MVGSVGKAWVLLDGPASTHKDDGAVSGVRVGRRPALADRVSGEGWVAGDDDRQQPCGKGLGGGLSYSRVVGSRCAKFGHRLELR